MDTNLLILLIIVTVLALPGGLFVASLGTPPRGKALSLLGGVIGDVAVAVAIYAFVRATKPSIDGLSFALGSFFACSMGVFAGALAVNFLLGLGRRAPEIPSGEF